MDSRIWTRAAQHAIIGPPPFDELEKLAAAAPPMFGAEYLTPAMLEALWNELGASFHCELAAAGGTKPAPPATAEQTGHAASRTATLARGLSAAKRAAISARMKKYWRDRRRRER